MDDRHHAEPGHEQHSHRAVPENAPDPVETRDPASRPTPARRRVWLFAVPAVAFLILGSPGWPAPKADMKGLSALRSHRHVRRPHQRS